MIVEGCRTASQHRLSKIRLLDVNDVVNTEHCHDFYKVYEAWKEMLFAYTKIMST